MRQQEVTQTRHPTVHPDEVVQSSQLVAHYAQHTQKGPRSPLDNQELTTNT